MKRNRIEWKDDYNDVEKFISIFSWMNGRESSHDVLEFYKYERCVLLLVDFSLNPPKIYETIDDLQSRWSSELWISTRFLSSFHRQDSQET